MEFDALLLSRLQFAFVISFHIIFPSFSIGLASFLAVLEGLWLATKRDVFLKLYLFWLKIFAIVFGLGVVSGVVMSYQIGTNWSVFAAKTGNVLGPLLGYEVMTAFFLEASFLGIMLFGWNRVGRGLHFMATCVVAAGTLVSAFWILAANSWMHTPAGYELKDGVFYATDWFAVIFNPSFFYRFPHMVVACYLTTGFVVGGVGAWYLLRGRHMQAAKTMLVMAIGLIVVLTPLQIFIGHGHGVNVHENQPAKLAAMEGHWETRKGAPLVLFGIPDEEQELNRLEVAIPKLGSLIVTGSLDGEIKGLKEWPAADRPPVSIVFWSFRVMAGLGFLMLFVGFCGAALLITGRLDKARWYHMLHVAMIPSGFIAVLAGWFTAEVGRQPFTVYGLLRTSESVSPIAAQSVGLSLLVFIGVYLCVFGAGVFYIIREIISGPGDVEPARPGASDESLFRALFRPQERGEA
jgi:cytochrome bd ubiquinol oxidase subunit I